MDFEKLLKVARKNELNKKEPVKYLQTKFKPPTKEQHEKDKTLSEGIQKFLARKEMEEKKKKIEAERRKQELMALRSKDPKAHKRIQTMLKRTKSANKSVMEDAIDNNNTADTLAGPSQPDEDDYGFVSETSSQLYNKLIQKMYSTPSNDLPNFAPSKKPSGCNLVHTKERVKMALLKQEEEDRLPHKRKKKEKEKKEDANLEYGTPDRDLSKILPEQNKSEKTKNKKPMPPPVDFHELLKIAEKKQYEPIVFEPKIKKQQEPEILMTKKQKMEYEKMQEWKRQRELKLQTSDKTSNSQNEPKSNSKMPKMTSSASCESKSADSNAQKKISDPDDKLNSVKKNINVNRKFEKVLSPNKAKDPVPKLLKEKQSGLQQKVQNQQCSGKKIKDDDISHLVRERDEALRTLKEKERLIRERDEAMRILKEKEQLIRERDEAMRKLKLLEQSEKNKFCAKAAEVPLSKTQKPGVGKIMNKSVEDLKSGFGKNELKKNLESKSSAAFRKGDLTRDSSRVEGGGKASTGDGSRPRVFPPGDLKQSAKTNSRESPSKTLQRTKRFPPADVRRKALALKRRRIESDDEYDSELDGFIDDDDNDMGSEEVSKVISEIFRYDKNKYSMYDDADDECMESNFAQISKEEFISTKCGILEDLKDIQREKAKMAKKQKR